MIILTVSLPDNRKNADDIEPCTVATTWSNLSHSIEQMKEAFTKFVDVTYKVHTISTAFKEMKFEAWEE